MRKDEMTNGRAKWIKCPEFEHVEIPPLHWGGGQAEQHQPINDEGGLGMFCKTFTVSGRAKASVDATSLGVFDLWINGSRVIDGKPDELKPGWADYSKHVMYYTYDISGYLKDGENTFLAVLAPGWYAGRISFGTYKDVEICFMAALHIRDD